MSPSGCWRAWRQAPQCPQSCPPNGQAPDEQPHCPHGSAQYRLLTNVQSRSETRSQPLLIRWSQVRVGVPIADVARRTWQGWLPPTAFPPDSRSVPSMTRVESACGGMPATRTARSARRAACPRYEGVVCGRGRPAQGTCIASSPHFPRAYACGPMRAPRRYVAGDDAAQRSSSMRDRRSVRVVSVSIGRTRRRPAAVLAPLLKIAHTAPLASDGATRSPCSRR
jgi:hypothetical protein